MTRELLLPLLAIVILVNAGVIAYVIGHRRTREPERPGRHAERRRIAHRPTVSWPSMPWRTAPSTAVEAAATGSWDDVLAREEVRAEGSGIPSAVLAVDLIDLDRARARLGPEAAQRLLVKAGIELRRAARPGDPIGWDGVCRFWVLVPGMDLGAARAYVDRLARAVAPALDGDRSAVRLAIGWGIRMPGGDLREAAHHAERHLFFVEPRAGGAV
jgi:GGDEF domain-containing protein